MNMQVAILLVMHRQVSTHAQKESLSHTASASTKMNRLVHGFGTRNIADIVNMYRDTYTHQCDGHVYTARITLPMSIDAKPQIVIALLPKLYCPTSRKLPCLMDPTI